MPVGLGLGLQTKFMNDCQVPGEFVFLTKTFEVTENMSVFTK